MRHPHPLHMMTMIYDQHFDHCFSLIAPSAFICCGVKVGSLSPECRPTKLASPTQKWMETYSSQNSVFIGTWNVKHDNIKLHILVDLRRNPCFTSRHCFSFCVSELHISAMNNWTKSRMRAWSQANKTVMMPIRMAQALQQQNHQKWVLDLVERRSLAFYPLQWLSNEHCALSGVGILEIEMFSARLNKWVV